MHQERLSKIHLSNGNVIDINGHKFIQSIERNWYQLVTNKSTMCLNVIVEIAYSLIWIFLKCQRLDLQTKKTSPQYSKSLKASYALNFLKLTFKRPLSLKQAKSHAFLKYHQLIEIRFCLLFQSLSFNGVYWRKNNSLSNDNTTVNCYLRRTQISWHALLLSTNILGIKNEHICKWGYMETGHWSLQL